MGLTGFNWVLVGFCGFYRVFLGFSGFSRGFLCLFSCILVGFTGLYCVLLYFTGFYWVFTRLDWVSSVLPSFTESHSYKKSFEVFLFT